MCSSSCIEIYIRNHIQTFVLCFLSVGSHGAGKFATPGGHLELDESWAECAIREVKEETNLDVHNLRFHHMTNDPCIGGKREKHYITIFMRADLQPGSADLENLEPHKCESWHWVPFSDVVDWRDKSPEMLFDPCVHLIQDGKTSL